MFSKIKKCFEIYNYSIKIDVCQEKIVKSSFLLNNKIINFLQKYLLKNSQNVVLLNKLKKKL